MYKLIIEVSIGPTDLNNILGVNKYKKDRIFKSVKAEMYHLLRGKIPEAPLENFRISVVRHCKKTMDFDNYISSLKPYIDSLTVNKVIKNDSWKYIRSIDVDQVLSPVSKLVITIEETERVGTNPVKRALG